MSTLYDPRELDVAWDAVIAGRAPTGRAGDDADRDLLTLLGALPHAIPTGQFVHTLECALIDPVDSMNGHHAGATRPAAWQRGSRARQRFDIRHWMPGGMPSLRYAGAVLALMLVVSTVAVVLQQRREDDRIIPAANELAAQGPATSADAALTTWFSHTYSMDELQGFAAGQWSWIEQTTGTIRPGERPDIVADLATPGASSMAGMYTLTATDGELTVELNGPAQLFRQNAESPALVAGPESVTLRAGDTLVYSADTKAALWNASNDNASYMIGATTTIPAHFKRPEGTVRGDNGGDAIPPGFAAGAESLEVSMSQIVLDPGETFAYTISPQTLLLAQVAGGGLEKQAWVDGERFGKPLKVLSKVYILNVYGTGYFTLTNSGAKPVPISLFSVAPPDRGLLSSPPSEPIDAPFGNWSITQPVPTPAS